MWKLILVNLISISCILIGGYLAYLGKEGWGGFFDGLISLIQK